MSEPLNQLGSFFVVAGLSTFEKQQPSSLSCYSDTRLLKKTGKTETGITFAL
ncbi:hypothetical protein [Fibrella aquatica]|jgi:hypothetical protein|uniref:hypothetical protein n=1 Tax=Fibrella aquatica TaxID=3242487 RepID=UPI00351FE66B